MTLEDFGFVNTFNMGYEGFSRPLPLDRMNPIYGNKNEFFILFGLITLVPLVKASRKSNEDALRAQTKTTNRFAELPLDRKERLPSQWSE